MKRVYGHENDEGKWVRPVPEKDDEYTYQWNSEWADDLNKPILKITKSSMSTFKWCKKQFEFSYLDRRPIEQNAAMLKGTVIHDSHEMFYKQVDMDKVKDSTFVEIKDYFQTLFPIDDYTEMTEKMSTFEAERYLNFKKAGILENFLPVGNEVMLNARILIQRDTDVKHPLNRDYVVHLQGIVDRVFKEDDHFIPMELKTGAWKDSKKTGLRRELAFYKLLMDSSDDCDFAPIKHWGWYFPENNHLTIEPVKKQTTNALKKSIAAMIFAYELDEFTPSYFHKKCVWCEYQDICPAAIDAGLNEGSDWF